MTLSVQHDYKCGICAKNFRDSLGDMEHHMLIEHMQKANLAFLKTDRQYKNKKI